MPREIKPEDSNFVIDTKKTKTVGILAGINRAELSRLVNVFILDKAATCVETNSITKALKLWVVWLEETEIDPFSPAALHYKSPTYGFREELLLKVNYHKSISYNTAANYINVIKNFYQFLGDINVLEPTLFFRHEQKFNGRGKAINATDLSIRPLRKHQGSSLNPLTKSECTVLLSIIEKLSRRDYLMIMLMLGCGLRGQEVITMNSCLFSSEVFSENESFLIQGLEIGPDVGVMTKFSIPRELFITKVLYEEVLDFVEDANYLRALKKAPSQNNCKPLFLLSNGNRINKSTLYNVWTKIKKEFAENTGKPLAHKPHDLRATFGSNLLRLLADEVAHIDDALHLVKTAMGHKNVVQTMKYVSHLSRRDTLAQAAEVLDAAAIKFYIGDSL